MSVLNQLATSQGIRGTEPNKLLAKKIVAEKDHKAVAELVANLNNKAVMSDCIKVLYEAGEADPSMIAAYAKEFIALLDSRNNRMQWGAMTALDYITADNAALVYQSLGKIIAIADKGSVITRDHCAGILIKLSAVKNYADDAFTLFIDLLRGCPPNQLPMYAEQALPVISTSNKNSFAEVLQTRLPDVEKESSRKRIEKVLRKVERI